MEFIDPKLKQKHDKRLKIGYLLLTILVGLATYILIMTALGYQLFQKDGQVIRNGIIFLDTKPVSADIFINGIKESSNTDVRLTLPESEYEIILRAEGYKDWTKRVTLDGGQVLFINYPRLLPNIFKSDELKSYSGDGKGFFTQSPDKKWILYQANSTSNEINLIDTTKIGEPQQVFSLPVEALGSKQNQIGRIEIIEWSVDNRHFLIKHTLVNGSKVFAIIDKDDLSKSLNINTLFNTEPSKVSLVDGKVDKVYLYFASGGLLRTGDIKNKALGEQLFDQILDYKSVGDNNLMLVTTKNSTSGNVTVNARIGNKVYLIGEIEYDPDGGYLLDAGEYSGDSYYVIGSNKASRAVIYKNPQNFNETTKDKTPNKLLTLKLSQPLQLSFSPDSRFVLVNSTNEYISYDIESKKSYKTSLNASLESVNNMSWLDGFLIQYTAKDKLYVSEFDGKNLREITTSKSPYRSFVDSEFKRIYNLKSESGIIVSQVTKLTLED